MNINISNFRLGGILSDGAKLTFAALLFAASTYANAAVCSSSAVNECEISFASSGTVTLTLLADHGGFDHAFYLLNSAGSQLVFASADGADSGTTSFGATITPIGSTYTISNYLANSELIFGLYGYNSSRLGGDNTLQTQFFTGSHSSSGSTPVGDGHISFVEGGGTHNLTVHMTDLFGQSSNFDGSDGNIKFSVQLAPVPEPETCAMLLAGLGLMGVMARRRRKQ